MTYEDVFLDFAEGLLTQQPQASVHSFLSPLGVSLPLLLNRMDDFESQTKIPVLRSEPHQQMKALSASFREKFD
jgi:hypothetical protein